MSLHAAGEQGWQEHGNDDQRGVNHGTAHLQGGVADHVHRGRGAVALAFCPSRRNTFSMPMMASSTSTPSATAKPPWSWC